MKELKRMNMDLPDMWIKTGEINSNNEDLYIASKSGWYKRGIMFNTPGILTFIKL
jgi:hypothetical protein